MLSFGELIQRLSAAHGDDAARRFAGFVDVDEATGCWRWTGGKAGKLKRPCFWLRGKSVQAAPLALGLALGRSLIGLACHECTETSCINPGHLREDNASGNLKDAWRRGER